jgi:hypothetical protein
MRLDTLVVAPGRQRRPGRPGYGSIAGPAARPPR